MSRRTRRGVAAGARVGIGGVLLRSDFATAKGARYARNASSAQAPQLNFVVLALSILPLAVSSRSCHDDQGWRQAAGGHAVRIHRGRGQRLQRRPQSVQGRGHHQGQESRDLRPAGRVHADLLGQARAVLPRELRQAQGQGRGRHLLHVGQRSVRDGRLGARPEGRRQGPHDGRRQRRLHEEARARARPHRRAAWACAASASRCWSTTAWSRRSTSRRRASTRSPTATRC